MVLFGSHVLDMKGKEGRRSLWKLTILAPMACPSTNELACRGIHQDEVCLRRNSRAFACKTVTK